MTSKPEASKAKKGVSRRTVVVGTAWAVPAIVVASAAPAMALSGPVTFTGRACKSPGNPKRYLFEITVTNSNNVPLQLNAISLVINGVTSANVCPTTGTIAANSPRTSPSLRGPTPTAPTERPFSTTRSVRSAVPTSTSSASTTFNDLPPIANPACPLSIPLGCFA